MTSQMDFNTKTPLNSKFRCVGIFGGRTLGRREEYRVAALKLGEALVARRLNLVHGGGIAGLPGIISQIVHKAGGHVLNIARTPPSSEEAFGKLQVVPDPHERKKEISRHADCFIVLPGDLETMEEFMEVISWAQLGIHDKPIGLLNVGGFFLLFMAQIDAAIEEGFIKPSQRGLIILSSEAEELLQKLEEYEPTREGAIPKHLWQADEGSSSSEDPVTTAKDTGI